MLSLYWVSGSIPSWRVMLALEEKGLPYTAHRLRVMGKDRQTRSPEFLAINPRGQAPALVLPGGAVVVESLAILSFLERYAPRPALLPSDPAALSVVLSRMHAVEILRGIYRPLEQLFRPLKVLQPHEISAAREVLLRLPGELAIWEDYLTGQDFIASDAMSLADCSLYPALAYQVRRGLDLSDFPRLQGYLARIAARPSAKAALPVGWEGGKAKDLFARARRLPEVSSIVD